MAKSKGKRKLKQNVNKTVETKKLKLMTTTVDKVVESDDAIILPPTIYSDQLVQSQVCLLFEFKFSKFYFLLKL